MTDIIGQALTVLRQGGVIAYPTEYCFGLGCDPMNQSAVQRILQIKKRKVDKGLILIAADVSQVKIFADLNATSRQAEILASWPGPVTWTLPVRPNTPNWICGNHSSIAMRVTAHGLSSQLCQQFGGAIVSTSANRQGHPEFVNAIQVVNEMAAEVDYIVNAEVGGAQQASQIKDSMTGNILR